MEETVTITAQELVEHTVVSRKISELGFKKSFLIRHGAKEDDINVKALDNAIKDMQFRIKPVSDKLEKADLLTVMPNAGEITALSSEIGTHSAVELDDAIMKKSGPAYDKMRERATLTKVNFDNRDEIARLTMVLNSMPRADGEMVKKAVEEADDDVQVDVSSVPEKRQHDLVGLLNRLGYPTHMLSGKLFFNGKKKDEVAPEEPKDAFKAESEGERQVPSGLKIWLPCSKLADFDANEKRLEEVCRKMQAKTAEKQVVKFSDEQQKAFEALQKEYMDVLEARRKFIAESQMGDHEAKVRVKKK